MKTNLKDKSAAWLESNWSLVVAIAALILVAINDSFIGVFVYTIVMHILCVAYAAGLFDKNFLSLDMIAELAKKPKTKMDGARALTGFITLCAFSIVVLAARDHWYLLFITIATITLFAIQVIDGIQKIRKYKKENAR